ncbi:hypothetical protein PspLS_03374 [Pyricularia sp. CBS 133598]|nr:hypothetical protein PspLS_03374 [Pyricularia sp. CBS 133598]
MIEYLRGAGTSNKNECESLFNDYKKCLGVALKKKGIDKLLDEAREDNKENDATHMGRRGKRSANRASPAGAGINWLHRSVFGYCNVASQQLEFITWRSLSWDPRLLVPKIKLIQECRLFLLINQKGPHKSPAPNPTIESFPPFYVQRHLDTRTEPRWRLPHTTPELDSTSSSELTIPAVARADVALPTVSLSAAGKQAPQRGLSNTFLGIYNVDSEGQRSTPIRPRNALLISSAQLQKVGSTISRYFQGAWAALPARPTQNPWFKQLQRGT